MTISVVIPSYNHDSYLRPCLDSVLGQTRPPDEVIVVDDGSTDESWEILQAYGDRIRAERQANQGTYATLNKAISRTTGDWIAIQNSDDVWKPEKLETQLALALANPSAGLVHTAYDVVDEAGDVAPGPPLVFPDFSGEPLAEMLPILLRHMPVIISSAVIPRRVWDEIGSFDERYYGNGDWDWCLRASEKYPFGYVNQPLTLVRKHPANSSTDTSRLPPEWLLRDKRIMYREKAPGAIRALVQKARRGEIPKRSAAFALAATGAVCEELGEKQIARQALRHSARLQPLRLKTHLRYLASFFR